MGRKRDNEDTEDRISRLKALSAELAEAAGINTQSMSTDQKLRLESASWIALSLDNLKSSILQGGTIEIGAVERFTNVLNDLLPRAAELKIILVAGEVTCAKCKATVRPESELGEMTEDGFVLAPGAKLPEPERKPASSSLKPISPAPGAPDSQNAPAASPARSQPVTNELLTNNEPSNIHAMIARINGGAGRSPFDPPPMFSRFDNRG